METLRLTIQGRVQGVWFRESMHQEAERLGLAGRVWNCPDGSVEAVIQGPIESVNALLDWARIGPPLARVDHIDQTRAEGQYLDFKVINK